MQETARRGLRINSHVSLPSQSSASAHSSSKIGTGTQDFVPYLSIIWAINFRKCIGGEQMIMSYCRNLAINGGKAMASILGTRILDDTPNFELTGAMVHILHVIPPASNI
jgi:hypothetical protein